MTSASAESSVAAKRTYRWDFDVLRIMAILGVVSIHVFGLILGKERLRDTDTWTFAVIVDVGAVWCVGIFVMISGALLLSPRVHAAGAGAFLRRRVVRLLPAMIVWHLVYLLAIRQWLFGEDLDPKVVFVNVIDAKVYTALYFLWLIFGLYLVAPILAAWLAAGGERRAKLTAIAAAVWTFALVAIPGVTSLLELSRPRTDNALTMWIPYVGLFVAGYAWRHAQPESRRWWWTAPTGVVLIGFVIWQFLVRPDFPWVHALLPGSYYGPVVVVATVCIFVSVIDIASRFQPSERTQRVLRALGEATFGVFLTHLIFLALSRKYLPELYDDPAPLAKTQLYLGIIVASFALSLLARRIPVLRRIF